MSESPSPIIVGRVYRTPFDPSGLFRVLQIIPAGGGFDEAADGEYVGDHPNGYAEGSAGRYFTKELAGREADDPKS